MLLHARARAAREGEHPKASDHHDAGEPRRERTRSPTRTSKFPPWDYAAIGIEGVGTLIRLFRQPWHDDRQVGVDARPDQILVTSGFILPEQLDEFRHGLLFDRAVTGRRRRVVELKRRTFHVVASRGRLVLFLPRHASKTCLIRCSGL
jgi:hypothetical protein